MKPFHILQKLSFLIFLVLMIHPSQGKIFNTSYVSFEIPENWQCKSFGTDQVCHSTHSQKEKEAMIILTAKIAGTLDTLETYTNFLQQPREGLTRAKQSFRSKVIHTKKVVINNHFWVDGFHKESEIPSYYTRYIVTTCCQKQESQLAILVTYSAHVNHYTKYASDFLKSINSLRVLNTQKAIEKMKSLGTGENLGSISAYMEDLIDDEGIGGKNKGGLNLFGLDATQLALLLFIILSLGAYTVIKIRKKNKKSHTKNRKKKRR